MLHLRPATRAYSSLIFDYIKELADYEELSHECQASEELIEKWLFDENKAGAVMAEWNGAPAGFALYFYNFSTFLTKPGIYIEDLFIRPDYRRRGIARNLFAYLARKVRNEGCGRLEWWVLDWNKDAIAFYESLGAESMNEWTVQRISGKALEKLASLS